ncbi:MAG: hypothetical protein Q7V88_13020 [Actinomycetota bacterium]|nr:hypothetical protein [Actinomycetota bacterium]
MNDEELQQRLRRIDPAADASIDPATGPRAAALMEQIMNTPFPALDTPTPSPVHSTRRWPKFALGGGVAAVLGGALAFATLGGGTPAASVTANYTLQTSDPMAMCIAITEYQPPAEMVGFKGVVTDIGDGTITLDVSKWYGGEPADTVVLATDQMGDVALDAGVVFEQGGEYLVGVLDGQVQTCGVSGDADPALEAIYDGWFAG